ncbi:MAG: MFS transporter [Candidatus Rokubacteria bacterium]|nr:MFS transporter [Candidatus Rokubacteria bacterium]
MEESRKRRALFGVMLTIFLGAMESTVVATAMPTVVASLGGLAIYSWVFSGFLLTSTVTMPLWGRVSDLLGRRRVYLAGLVVFLVGSALSGAATTMVQLIVFRMLQGLGAGSLITLGMTVVGDLYGLERRAKMQGYISGVWGIASLVGPLIGGVLSDLASWRWVFYINVPFGLIAMAVIASALPPDVRRARAPIDYRGLALFATAISALLVGLAQAGRAGRWTGADVVVPLAAAALALVAFFPVERRAAEPVVPLRLFAHRMVVAAAATGFLSGMAMFGAISFVPLFVQAVNGSTATRAGFVLTPFVLGWVAMSITGARLVLRVGYRALVVSGMACLAGAFLLFMRWSPALTEGEAMRDMLLGGIGMGLSMVPMLIGVQSAVPRADLGAATSMTQFFRAIGGAIGLSIMGTVMAQRLDAGQPMAFALHGVFVVGMVICVAAVLAAFLVPPGRARDLARGEAPGEPAVSGRMSDAR